VATASQESHEEDKQRQNWDSLEGA